VSAKQDALVEVVEIIRRHDLTIDEITAALGDKPAFKQVRYGGVLSRLFGYVGGIFVFAGLAIYVGMRWDHLGPLGHVLLTLGVGFSVFLLALVCSTDARVERASTPLFLVAALLQPTGIIVMMQEYSRSGNPAHGLLFMNAVMAIQQGFTFWAKDRTVLAFTTIVFGLGFFTIAFDLLHVPHHLIGVVIGISLLCIAWSVDHSRHRSLSGLIYFVGSGVLLGAAFDWVRRTPGEVLFLGLACAVIFLSTLARSRSLLLVGTLGLVGYLSNFIAEHFANNLNGPLLLMLVGFVLIALGAAAITINNRYIKQPL
jgi:hypothetical protein